MAANFLLKHKSSPGKSVINETGSLQMKGEETLPWAVEFRKMQSRPKVWESQRERSLYTDRKVEAESYEI